MKRQTVLISLEDLGPEMLEPEPNQPALASPKPTPASAQDLPDTRLTLVLPAYSGFVGYPHWGLNE